MNACPEKPDRRSFTEIFQNLHVSLLEHGHILGYNMCVSEERKEVPMLSKLKSAPLYGSNDVDELIFRDEDVYVSEK